jgi:hypothetical protein
MESLHYPYILPVIPLHAQLPAHQGIWADEQRNIKPVKAGERGYSAARATR